MLEQICLLHAFAEGVSTEVDVSIITSLLLKIFINFNHASHSCGKTLFISFFFFQFNPIGYFITFFQFDKA
jgi:hypothetical protein